MSAPMGLEYKNAASPDAMPADAAGALHEGVIEALVAVTGVKDDVGDVIVPGAFTNTLKTRKPKVCLGHDWNRPIGKTLQIKELMPGDPALPKTTADGKPWPKEAGAVWAQFQTNMDIDDGKNAFHSAKFYGPESTYSIGYKATTAKHKGGTRYIHELDLFEFGPVLHPANRLATLQSIKSGEPDDIEYTDADLDEEKGVAVEELTLRDYAAILDIMEEKAVQVRRVADAEYWGLPVGTIIKPGMKPKGKSRATTRGTTVDKTGGTSQASAAKPAAKPKADTPTETLEQVQKVGEELGMEVRANPWPPEYIVKEPKGTRGYGGRVISFSADTGRATTDNGIKIPDGRVEEYMRTWLQERDKDKGGYSPSAEWVLSQMDRPAREAAAKKESEAKKREILAGATDEQLEAQGKYEADRVTRINEIIAGNQGDKAAQERTRESVMRNLELVNEERAKRGQPAIEAAESEIPAAAHPSLEEFGPEAPGLSAKPTGGRSITEILDSLPVNTSTQNVRYRIAHGEDVLDDPTGSGVFAVTDSAGGKKKGWTVTVGSGQSLPTGALLADATNDKTAMPTTPKKMAAWLTALGSLRDANGNPPPYGAPDSKTILGWKDTEGRGLAQAIRDTAVPAYLAAIGKDDGFRDRSTPAMWKRNPADAMSRMPVEMRNQLATLNFNGRQAYYLNRSEGNDHATALQRVREMIANAQRVSETVTPRTRMSAGSVGGIPIPQGRAATEGNQLQPTPEGEISTDRLLMMSRVTGPAAIAAMELPELERHDAELTRRAAALGKPGQISPAHEAIKKAASARRDQQRREERAALEAAESPEQQRKRQIEEAPSKVADARRMGRMSRGEIALREANKEVPFGGLTSNAYNAMRGPDGVDGARADGVASAELARGIASDAEFLARADTADRVADLIDSWGVDLGEESDLPGKLRAWAEGVRSVLDTPALGQEDSEVGEIRQRFVGQSDDNANARDEATIAPELLDEAAEGEAASVGLSETPDGVLEVEPEVAERQDRVEKLIKDADDGKLSLAEKSTEDLTSTRRDLVDELRLQTAMRRRAPRAPRTTATEAPKVRPGLAGAAEDHAEALRSGDAAAIERTRARLESSIRRSRVDSEIARSLADTVASPDDNDADQLSDLAKRLRAESRERRNATARKRRTAKRIERERLQSLLGAVDTELRSRGVELEQVPPDLLAPDQGEISPDGIASANGRT